MSAEAKAEVFKMRAEVLERGISRATLYATDSMWAHLKIYADGGENDLHCHPREEHAFFILEGQATFYDRDEKPTVVNKYEGIFIPKGVYYRFSNTGEGNLALLRTGTGSNPYLPQSKDRIALDGSLMPFNPSQVKKNTHIGVPIPGKFWGASE